MAKTPVEVAELYAELFNQGKHAEMGELYAEDSLWSRPGSPELFGKAAISAMYASPQQAEQTVGIKVTHARYFVDGNAVAAEYVFEGPRGTSHIIDLFELDDDGLITSMKVFLR